jgi:hypothetical protein
MNLEVTRPKRADSRYLLLGAPHAEHGLSLDSVKVRGGGTHLYARRGRPDLVHLEGVARRS